MGDIVLKPRNIERIKSIHFENSQVSERGEILGKLITDYSSNEVLQFLKLHCNLTSETTQIVSTDNLINLEKFNKLDCIINLHKINDIRFINKFFEGINQKLSVNDTYICCVETFQARKKRKKTGNIPIIKYLYFCFEFIFLRVFPKIWGLKSVYFSITKGKNRLLSKAETLGRLVSCGFKIHEFKTVNGLLYIVVRKEGTPKFDMNPSYGPIYKMPRVGKNKKIIKVYKLRTMHPYSEYLQGYLFQKNGTNNGDKVNNDFRVSKVGRLFRKVWLDELPMLINLLKGDIKIVGVRPLSVQKFNMYPKEAQVLRVKFKPGLVPPFYADLPNNFEELVDSEIAYLKKYSSNPILTDLKYFFKAFYNIFVKGARSK